MGICLMRERRATGRKRNCLLHVLFLTLTASCVLGSSSEGAGDLAERLTKAVEAGRIAYKLTSPDELIAILGEPQSRREEADGGMCGLDLDYPEIRVLFGKSREDKKASYAILGLQIRGQEVDIGGILQGQRRVIVRSIADLHRMDIQNVDLRNLDLSGEGGYLKKKEFDSLTQWPGPERLPPGFDPRRLLDEGKNPGLGVRALHKEGVNGEGVGIAILDQPLLLGHEEYTSRLIHYDAAKASWLSPQFHGSPVVGIAVGRTCGVAPDAFVFYYASCTTSEHRMQADYIKEIIRHNETQGGPGRIRVISISAAPEESPDNDAFMRARKEAMDAGILVVTCSARFLRYGTATLVEGTDPDKPENYRRGRYAVASDEILVPTGNKAVASYQGTDVYTYEREGGMSWAAPYIAGLAALAFQVNPDLQPQTIVEQLVKTATRTDVGAIVNPRAFIESVKASQGKGT